MENIINSSKIPFDIRAEVLAYLLTKTYGLSTEQVLFRPQNFFQRWGRRDVIEVSKDFSYQMDKEIIALNITREGLFDILPEGIFFHPDDDYPDDVYKIKKLSEQEAAARKFLAPFEQLFYWLRLQNEQREFEAESSLEQWWQELLTESAKQGEVQEGYSPLRKSNLEEEQRNMLTHLLPSLHEVIGNWNLTAQWLSLFLDTPVRIKEVSPPIYTFSTAIQKRIGEGILGQDFVIGTTFSDGIPALQILIEGLTPDVLGDFLEDGIKRQLLEEELLQLLLPVETPYEIIIQLQTQSTEFQIGNTSSSSILGYTTTLSDSHIV